MSDINEVIQRVLDLDREATGGPWEAMSNPWTDRVSGDSTIEYAVRKPGGGAPVATDVTDPETHDPSAPNACLIAEYRTAAPDLARALVAEQGRVADLERQLAASNARADAATKRAIEQERLRIEEFDYLCDGRIKDDDIRLALVTSNRERDALRADLARVTAERDELDARWKTELSHANKWARKFYDAESDLAAARQDAEALRGRAGELEEALDEILDYRGGADSALEDRYVMERVSGVRGGSAPPAPAPAPDLDAERATRAGAK